MSTMNSQRSEGEQPLLVEYDVETQLAFATRPIIETIDEYSNPLTHALKVAHTNDQKKGLLPDVLASAAARQPTRGGCVPICCSAIIAGVVMFMVGAACALYISGTRFWLNVSVDVDRTNDFYRESYTGFHFQPPKNWMNDPNGPMYYKGFYHFFYQYNPDGVVWGKVAWGHAVSRDLIYWTHLELAIMPDQWYDSQGVWSGSATILEDGTPVIVYTGARGRFLSPNADQSQNIAVPVDPSDPLLRKWRKVDSNPILEPPPGIRPQDFRDPTTAWLEDDGFWRLAVGAKRDNPTSGNMDGVSLIYKSKDFVHWEMEPRHLHVVNGTGMWECVDFFPVAVGGRKGLNHTVLRAETYVESYKYVLKASRDDVRHDYYAIGTYSTENHTFLPDNPDEDVGLGPRYDYGKFYASKTFFDTSSGRRILWGWANESDSEADDVAKGWASVQAIPRTVWLEEGTTRQNFLMQWPVEEVESLRGHRTSYRDIELPPASIRRIGRAVEPQLDILIDFEKPHTNGSIDGTMGSTAAEDFECSQDGSSDQHTFGPFGLLVHADDALEERTAVYFQIAASRKTGEWRTLVCSDQSRSSLAPGIDKTVYGSSVTVLPSDKFLSLRILVDHSILETFAQHGRLAITSRVYPMTALGPKSNIFFFNNGTSPVVVRSLDIYRMRGVNTNHI